jgi:hypothetical protein
MIWDTLTSPIILFFLLGMFAGFARSDLNFPEAAAKALAIYLMAAIGLKGGVEVAKTGLTSGLMLAALGGMMISFLLPLPVYAVLRRVGGLAPVDAAATAAHYGSVSLVTFVAAGEMLKASGHPAAGYMVAVLALMETPAILTGLLLARRLGGSAGAGDGGRGLWHDVFLNGSVVLLVGAFLIGLVAGPDGFAPVKPLFEGGYRGVLCLFLLDMGLVASRRLIDSRAMTWRLGALGVAMPLVNGVIGLGVGMALGLDRGSATILGVLAASASYIAVPAAMRLALPAANPAIYLSMSLGITFPFNIIVNVALLSALAGVLYA